jgi:uncharacterized Fe-S cluster protein YjdI
LYPICAILLSVLGSNVYFIILFFSPFTMKVINTNQLVKVPEGVDVSVKSRVVTVKGHRGTLVKSFKHLSLDIFMKDAKTVQVEKWFGKKKELAAVRTVCSHITNCIKGVTYVSTRAARGVGPVAANVTFFISLLILLHLDPERKFFLCPTICFFL